ncbi:MULTISPECIES: hypothetical protein [Dickeya]|uniref:Uncharacterized protein n=1 Tax=Dickeya fangzhongdai TaxID=1778540 RepID=A0A2K8QLG6_9GAMM|nr:MULTISPECIES: hypothetical protein [Dickeya]ATZ94357.1 hypothetical protein CVE23_10495 [Dickeya fangzhongdai]QOH47794.1 hypothetical protein DYD82_10545 [Dickeya fangzhongdai]QOH52099.1 hypothetical protein DYD83_10545 [Dickeya fangzhongdai]UGA52922.1 hypothetical protein QR68_09975 [Dickeya fangzhongdai]UWH09250.1 hypothetical protein K0H75_09965 [Dickeya fangzhongdai]
MKHAGLQHHTATTQRQAQRQPRQPLQDNRASPSATLQLKGDRYYWVRPAGGNWTYVGSFKSHAAANQWWAANKSAYPGGVFSQGNSSSKFK